MLKYVDTLTVAQHWVCPIEYGDYDTLTDSEIRQLNHWLKQYPYASFEWSTDSSFDVDDITGVRGDCLEVRVYVPA